MKWFSKILVSIALFNIAIGPAFAGNMTDADKAKMSQYRDYLEPMGYRLVVDEDTKKAMVYDKTSNKLAMEIPFGEEANLRKFSPKSLNRMLLDEMVRIKGAGKAAFSHSMKALPTESLIFFVAMGAVVAGQLIANYSQNPIAMKQHIEHQLSPIGVFGFFAFMASQGLTSNVLAMYMTNPKFHHMIPYLGMTVGAFVQSYLSQIASDPNVMACGKVMMGGTVSQKDQEAGIDADPCAKAYEYLVLKKKIWEFAPGIVSMLASSALAGFGQAMVTRAVLKLTGVDIALWLMPGSMQLKGVRLLVVKGLQISAFIAIDAWLNRKVVYAWKNFFDGADFNDMNKNLVTQVNDLKKSQWSTSNKELQGQIKNFRSKMAEWRMMNLSEVYEAHQAWSENLHQLTSMYNSSYAFYNAFVNEVRNARFDQQPLKPLLVSYPLNGVPAKGLEAGKEDLYFQSPKMLENWQADTVADVVAFIDQLTNGKDAKYLYPPEAKKLKAIRDLLASDDRMKMGEGLALLNSELQIAVQNLAGSRHFPTMLSEIKKQLGRPDPMLEPGRGFLATYEIAPSTAENFKGTSYYRQVGVFYTPHMTDYLMMQMICGPDTEKGEKAVKNSRGFPSVFLPPQLKSSNDDFGSVCDSWSSRVPAEQIYRWPIKAENKKQYKGFLSYLVDNARPGVVGTADTAAFPQWWVKTTESQMQAAFEEYAKGYDGIVANMMRTIYRQERNSYSNVFAKYWDKIGNSTKNIFDKGFWGEVRDDKATFNRGPISNGAMNSAFQEERVYLSILNELLAPTAKYSLDLATILTKTPTQAQLKEVENQFAALNGMIQQIKVTQKDGRDVIQSNLENYQLEEQLQKIQAALTQVSSALGVGDAAAGALVQLSPAQQEVAVSCLENLQALASEVMMYGSMANAVSWEKIRNIKQANIQQKKFNNEVQERLAAMRGMTMPGKP
ncbi:hypothetical protein [Bdellovibrio svalbardensis]|uniref:Uncharacterized protein n=1 Tax=Bdellovibrio svalbardensis TaxID=2972972 RepID=A0ABT6DE39_9BACT|nr:hypothetical protein [Bdellovibrio svalbardensis]MDG0814794.1 hypothetical protein [Bdellovibrio svalbardensis]